MQDAMNIVPARRADTADGGVITTDVAVAAASCYFGAKSPNPVTLMCPPLGDR